MYLIFFTHYFSPEGNAPASRTHEHCLRWVNAGHRVVVITCAPNVPDGVVYNGYRNRLWPQRETIDGIEVIRVWTYLAANSGGTKRILNYLSYLFSAVFAFTFFCRRPDVVVATSPQFFCGWAGALASLIKWRPFVLEIRDIWPESIIAVDAIKRGTVTNILELLEKWMYGLANQIVAVGNGYRDNIRSKIGAKKTISVITNGVDGQIYKPLPKSRDFLERYELNDRFVCSYVGTLGMAHGLDVVVRAASLLQKQGRNDIVFCLVGDGARRRAHEAQVEHLGLEHLVKFTGRLAKSKMPEILASSDCLLVHLKKTDLFATVIPSKIFESMAMNRPLIMGVRGDAAEIVRAAQCGIEIEPDNESDLLSAINKLVQDRELYEQLCQRGRETVMSNFSRDILAERMLGVLKEAANLNR